MVESQRHLVYACSLDYARLTGGWVYNSRLVTELAQRGWTIERLDLPAGFPQPDAAARGRARQQFAGLVDGAIVMLDQICLSPISDIAVREAERLRWVMIFHHPMALENEADVEAARRRAQQERTALNACRLVVASSRDTRDRLVSDYGVPAHRIVTVVPGLDAVADRGRRQAIADTEPRLLAVGAVVPRKGYDVLIGAMAMLADMDWRLAIVGDTERAPDYVAQLQRQIADAGLQDRVRLTGGLAQAELDELWRTADVFVASSRHEGYGMAVAEAIARGIPTVTTEAGAIGGWLDPSAAVIVREHSAPALAEALRRVLGDGGLRAELARNARRHAKSLPSWADTSRLVHDRLVALATAPPA